MDSFFHDYKNVRIDIKPKELSKGGWVVGVTLHHYDANVGTKYEVKTIYSTRMEAEISGLALARGLIDKEE